MNDGYNRFLMMRKIRRAAAAITLIVSLALIVWASLPNSRASETKAISPDMMQLESGGMLLSLPAREARLEWPKQIRIDEKEVITLSFVPVNAEETGNDPPVDFYDIYSKYSLMAEVKYNVAGMMVNPANPRRESMPAGQPLTFKWQVSTNQVEVFNGTVWLSLRYLPLDGSQAIQEPIYIQDIKIEATSLLGMNESEAYLVGVSGILLSGVIIYDDLLVFLRAFGKKLTTKSTKDTKD